MHFRKNDFLTGNIRFLFRKPYQGNSQSSQLWKLSSKEQIWNFLFKLFEKKLHSEYLYIKETKTLDMSKIHMFYKNILKYLVLWKIKSMYRDFSKVYLLYISFLYINWFEKNMEVFSNINPEICLGIYLNF